MFEFLKQRRPAFEHGVHPAESKETTRGRPIRQFAFAPLLAVPLLQHIGKPAKAIVRDGQEVRRGQLLAEPDGHLSVAMHAPVSGVVKRLALVPSITGRMVPGIYLEPSPGSTQEVLEGEPVPLDALPDAIVRAVQWAGIVGLGGAAFPTHAKLIPPPGQSIDTLIVNGVECEPYLSTDHRVMLEQADDIILGIRYLLRSTGAGRAMIGVEANKLDTVPGLEAAAAGLEGVADAQDVSISVHGVPVKYPQGAEKMLIKALLGREVPTGGLPAAVGALSVNVATAAEIGRLLPHGRGIQERVITVAGPAVEKPGNYRMPIGTPLRFVLETVGVAGDLARVVMGGPMMGTAASNLDIPVQKGTSGVLAYGARDVESGASRLGGPVLPCIRCADCVDACPMFLDPSQLGRLATASRYGEMADDFHLFDCFECGACSFVCPSRIPLVQHFRVAKGAIRRLGARA